MSTIKTTTLSNLAGTSTVPVDTVVKGSAKAWVNFNGTGTVAIRASFNVSSITDNGVGDYTVNFTSAMSDSNFAVSVSGDAKGDYTAASRNNLYGGIMVTTSSARVSSWDIGNVAEDAVVMSVAIFR